MPDTNEEIIGDIQMALKKSGLDGMAQAILIAAFAEALQAKDTTHKEEKRRILEGMPCERVKFESNCDHDCQEVVCEDFTEEFYHYGLNAHVQESKAYRDKELNNL